MERRTRWVCLWAALTIGAGLTGCSSAPQAVRINHRPMLLGPIGTPASTQSAVQTPGRYEDSAWQALLLKHVAPGWNTHPDPQTGKFSSPPYPQLVEYRAILQQPADLNAYLAVLERTGPTTTPEQFTDPAERIAYYINAYNACAVRVALANYPSESAYGPTRSDFETDWYFRVDGRRVNLHDLRQNLWVAADGDVRPLFALCEAAIGSPPLAPHPYRAQDLYEELAAQVQACMAMPQFVAISHDQRQLQLWWRILRHGDAFADWYQKLYGSPPGSLLNVVMDMAPPARRGAINRAVGYKIVEVPFDRRLNDLVVRASEATPHRNGEGTCRVDPAYTQAGSART